jgi:hypothetical protein
MRVSTRLSALCAAVLVPASLLAQSQPCASLNDSSNSVSTAITALNFAVGNNTYAWRFVPQQVHVATGLRIYTNNNFKAGFMKLEIWDESGSAPEPGKRLGGGTWRYEQDSTPKWQGAAFDGPIPLRPQTAYWFVWQEPGFSTVPTEPGAALMSGSVRLSGSSWVSTQASELKWRLYCQGLDTVGTQSYGPSCPSSSQQLGALFNNEAPVLGNTNFRLEASGLPSSAPALWLIGVIPSFPNVPVPGAPGCSLNTDIALIFPAATGGGPVQSTAAAGHSYFPLSIPNQLSLRGLFFAVQVAAVDTGATSSLPLVFTNGLRTTIQ